MIAQCGIYDRTEVLLRSEGLGKLTKLLTVAANNNRDRLTRSLYYYLLVTHTYKCYP